ncbi:MAG: hypothetical protein ChlgKO_01150 [Chlamydiales bacterium]
MLKSPHFNDHLTDKKEHVACKKYIDKESERDGAAGRVVKDVSESLPDHEIFSAKRRDHK